MNSHSCTGTGDSRQGRILGQCLQLKKCPIQPKKGVRILRMEMHHKGTLHGGACVPKSVTVTGQVLLPCILMDVHCWLVCAIAKPQVSSMQFWYIFLFYCSKRSLCEVAQLLSPSRRGQPWHPDTGELVSEPAACKIESRAGHSSKNVGDVHCAEGKKGLQSRAEQFACLEMSVEKMPVLPECSPCVSVGWAKKMNPQIVIWLSATLDIQAGLNSCMVWVQSRGYQQQGGKCAHHGVEQQSLNGPRFVAPQRILLWELQVHHFQPLKYKRSKKSEASHCLKEGSRQV